MSSDPRASKESYTVDFSTRDCLDYVPVTRKSRGLDGAEIYRPDWRIRLDAAQLSFVRATRRGQRTIRETAACVAEGGRQNSPAAREKFARKLFQELWRLDSFAMARKDTDSRH